MNRLSIVWLASIFVLVFAHTPTEAGGEDRGLARLIPAEELARAAPRIVNGTLTSSYPTVGALLVPFDPAVPSVVKEVVQCSGTMIGCDTFMTAAHCFCPPPKTGAQCQGESAPKPANYTVFLQHGGFFAVSSIAVHPDYQIGLYSDVAVVKLSSSVTGIAPTPINTKRTPPAGTLGTIVGFGRSGGDLETNLDYGLKRVGKVTTSSCPSPIPNLTHVCWAFTEPLGPAGQDSTICQGDSGGPLLIVLGSRYVAAGTTSGSSNTTCLPPTNGFDDNVFNDRAWIQTQAGSDLGNTRCGDIAQVETADAAIFTASDQLSSTTPARSHEIDVPIDATLLRVALNGDDHGDNNFDLYVQSPTTADAYACNSTRNSQYEFCEIQNPAAGIWTVTVARTAGEGRYQLTATTFAPGAGPGPRSKEEQTCAKAIRGWFTTFFKAKLAAQQACIDKVNKGKGTPPCPDAKAAAAIARAAGKIDPVKVGEKCPAEMIPTLGLGGACDGAVGADDLAACIVSEAEAAVDAVLAVEYSQPEAVLTSTAEQKCQAAVAKVTGKQYTAKRLSILSTCLTRRDAGKVASCPDPSAADKLTKAVAKVGPAIAKKCSDAVVQTLNTTSFGGSCATATTAAALASCQVVEHDAAIDDTMLSRLQ